MIHPDDTGEELVKQIKGETIPLSEEERYEVFERRRRAAEQEVKEEAREGVEKDHLTALVTAKPTDPLLAALRYFEMRRQNIEEP